VFPARRPPVGLARAACIARALMHRPGQAALAASLLPCGVGRSALCPVAERAQGARTWRMRRGPARAQVYKGRRKFTGQIVALKFIKKHGKSEKDVRNLRQEIEILSNLRHENIIKMLDWFETKTDFCVVTEFAHGAPAAPRHAPACRHCKAGNQPRAQAAAGRAHESGRVAHAPALPGRWPSSGADATMLSAVTPAGELFEVLEDDQRLGEAEVQRIAKQLVQARAGPRLAWTRAPSDTHAGPGGHSDAGAARGSAAGAARPGGAAGAAAAERARRPRRRCTTCTATGSSTAT